MNETDVHVKEKFKQPPFCLMTLQL